MGIADRRPDARGGCGPPDSWVRLIGSIPNTGKTNIWKLALKRKPSPPRRAPGQFASRILVWEMTDTDRIIMNVEGGLLESHPQHVGKAKRFRGIAGSLFAFAAQLSFAIGGEGFVTIDAKSELIEHYRWVYGFREDREEPKDDPNDRSRREIDRAIWWEAP